MTTSQLREILIKFGIKERIITINGKTALGYDLDLDEAELRLALSKAKTEEEHRRLAKQLKSLVQSRAKHIRL